MEFSAVISKAWPPRRRIDPGVGPESGSIVDSTMLLPRRYSAAAASDNLGLAADSMKSEMRGTISDLNREPLKTP
jgi:hypothetical protein